MRKKLGQLLCEKSYLTDSRLESALSEQAKRPGKLGDILLELGYLTRPQLLETLAAQTGIKKADLEGVSVTPDLISLVPAELVSKYNILPLAKNNGRLDLAMVDPFHIQAVEPY